MIDHNLSKSADLNDDAGNNTALGDAALLGGSAIAGRELLNRGIDRTLGVQRFVHGTSSPAVDGILQSGLQPSFGGGITGTSVAVNQPHFIENSKNHVHVALDNPFGRGIANMHGAIAQIFRDTNKPLADPGGGPTPEARKLLNRKLLDTLLRPGKYRVGGAMPYDQFRDIMQVDKDHVPFLAFKTQQAIPADTLRRGSAGLSQVWSALPRNVFKYMGRNPVRALTGLASLTAAGIVGNAGANAAARLANTALGTSSSAKSAALNDDIQLQEHQQRVQDRVVEDSPRMLVYHGLGSGKSLSALAAAEAAKKQYGGNYGVVVPASLRGNFEKEIGKFTTGSNPEVLSYTGLGMGKDFQDPPETLIMDEAHRLRNPGAASARAAARAAARAQRLLLLTGSPITNSPADMANLLSLLHNKQLTPEEFEKKFIGYKTVRPGIINWLRGIKPGEKPVVKNEKELRQLLAGKIDYQPSKTPEGVNVNEETVRVPLSPAQDKIQKAIRTKIPPGFLWKLDQEFPLSREELAKLNSFMTGLRQVSLSTQPFRADKDPVKAFEQSAKLQEAFKRLQKELGSDPRKKAIIYSNFVDSGLGPYAAGLEQAKIPHAFFHGGVSPKARQAAVDAYNKGKLKALLIGPAGAEGLSTKGTSLIQLLDPHWHESRSQQAKGRGLRFDSHRDLPEELKNVAVQRYLSASKDPSFFGKLMGYKRERTGDEVLERLTADKERLNEEFRKLLREEGLRAKQEQEEKQSAELPDFNPDYTPGQLHRMGVYKSLYEKEGPRLASLGEWKPEWVTEHDPKGWLEWYQNYNSGRRIPEEDMRQIKRWANFKSRHGGPFITNPTARRGWALRHWAINPEKLVPERAEDVRTMLQDYQAQELKKYLKRRTRQPEKTAEDADTDTELSPVKLLKPLVKAYAARALPKDLTFTSASDPVKYRTVKKEQPKPVIRSILD